MNTRLHGARARKLSKRKLIAMCLKLYRASVIYAFTVTIIAVVLFNSIGKY